MPFLRLSVWDPPEASPELPQELARSFPKNFPGASPKASPRRRGPLWVGSPPPVEAHPVSLAVPRGSALSPVWTCPCRNRRRSTAKRRLYRHGHVVLDVVRHGLHVVATCPNVYYDVVPGGNDVVIDI